MSVLHIMDRLHVALSPYVVGAAVVMSVYCSAASYGVITVVQVSVLRFLREVYYI